MEGMESKNFSKNTENISKKVEKEQSKTLEAAGGTTEKKEDGKKKQKSKIIESIKKRLKGLIKKEDQEDQKSQEREESLTVKRLKGFLSFLGVLFYLGASKVLDLGYKLYRHIFESIVKAKE